VLLVEAAKLAARRRSEDQAQGLCDLAGAFAAADDEAGALRADWEFMAALVEAAGNLVFQLIMNSVRQLYLPNAASFVGMVQGGGLAPLYARAAGSVRDRDAEGAAQSVAELASAHEERMVGGR
jgi:DNA-binding FadR family transcriptional regulator